MSAAILNWRWFALWALLALLAGAGSATAQSVAAGLYVEGNQLYRDGKFEEARKRYVEAVATGIQDPRLFYNLGNASYKAGQIGAAILWYERALKLAPRDEDILANLRFLRRVKRDRDPETDGSVLYEMYLWPTLNELFAATSGGLLALFALACWRLWRRSGTSLSVATVALGAWIAGSALFTGLRLNHDLTRVEAVVMQAEGTARSGPEADQTSVFVVHEGTKMFVERQEGDWLLVRLANGLGGWLPAAVVEII